MPYLSFRGRRELSTDLQLQHKEQNHKAISRCYLTRSEVWAKRVIILPILVWKYSNVEQKWL